MMDASIPWEEVEGGLAEWVTAATGIPEDNVYFQNELGPRRTAPYVVISAPLTRNPGTDWTKTVRDAESPTGFTFLVQGHRVINIQIQAFAETGNDATSARAIIAMMFARTKLPSVQAAARAAHFGFGPKGDINTVTAGEDFEPRAFANIDIHVGSEVSEPGYVIERVEIKMKTIAPDGIELDEQTQWVPGPGAVLEVTLDPITLVATGTVT